MKRLLSRISLSWFALVIIVALATTAQSQNAGQAARPLMQAIDANAETGTALAVVVDPAPLAHTAQFLPVDARGRIVGRGDVTRQAENVLGQVAVALKLAESGRDRMVKLNICVAGSELVPQVQKVLAREFRRSSKPAVCFVAGELAHPEALVAMDAVGVSKGGGTEVRRVRAGSLPGANAVAHAAVLPAGGVVYVSGMAEKGELGEATRKTLEKLLNAISHLELAGKDVVQLKAFVNSMSEVSAVEREVIGVFGNEAPPVVYVEWRSAGAPIEIELIARAGETADEDGPVSYITPPGTTSAAVYSRIARINDGKRIFISGLYGREGQSGEEQILHIFDALGEVLGRAGSDFNHLVKATYYVSDNETNGRLNALRPRFYDPKRPPAASKAMVRDVGMTGRSVTVDMIAVTRD